MNRKIARLLSFLAVLALAGCLQFDGQEITLRYDREKDRLDVLLVYRGIYDNQRGSDAEPQLDDAALNEAFKRFKDLADRKREVFDEDIMALVDDSLSIASQRIKFVSLQVVAGSKGPQLADLELEIDGKVENVQARGNGPVDATFNAIKKLVPHTAILQLYQVHAITGGTDAQAEVTVRLEENGRTVNGQGADTDTLVASAKAYIHALNKLYNKRTTMNPQTARAAMTP